MTALDWILLAVGVPAFVYGLTPNRFRFWERPPVATPSTVATPSKVMSTVDTEQSTIYCLGGGMSLVLAVFVTIENQLDVDVQLKDVRMRARMKDGSSVDAGEVHFDHKDRLTGSGERVSTVHIPKRSTVEGWFISSHDGTIRIADFSKFEMTVQAVGEPMEVHCFEPYDWDDVKHGQSTIVSVAT